MSNNYLKFEDLTEEQINYFWNGVGSDNFSLNPHDLIFKDASKMHDFLYWRGGDLSDRKAADKRFCRDAAKAVAKYREKSSWYKLPIVAFYWSASKIYCIVLTKVGNSAFEYGEKCKTWEQLKDRIDLRREEMRIKKEKKSSLKYKLKKIMYITIPILIGITVYYLL